MSKKQDRITIKQALEIVKLLNLGIINAYDTNSFRETAVNPEDIIAIMKGDK